MLTHEQLAYLAQSHWPYLQTDDEKTAMYHSLLDSVRPGVDMDHLMHCAVACGNVPLARAIVQSGVKPLMHWNGSEDTLKSWGKDHPAMVTYLESVGYE